jgi:hypothetical protein
MAVDPDVNSIMKDVDEHKDKLPDGVYLKICNSLKRIHHKLCNPKRKRNRNIVIFGYISLFSFCKWMKMLNRT